MYLRSENASIMMTAFGDGPRTIVAHGGWVGSGELWFPVFEYLSRRWRTVTYDHRGTGATISTAPKITFDLLVDDLFRVLDALHIDRCVLAGESAGAAIVLEAVLRHPSRFDGLVIVDGRYVGERTTQLERMLQGCRSDFDATMDAFVNACVPEADCAAERAWGKLIVKRSNGQAAIELVECLDGIDIASRLPTLSIPTLVIHGSRDVITPVVSSERLVSLLPYATLAIAEGAGHVPTITRPYWVAEKIEQFAAAAA